MREASDQRRLRKKRGSNSVLRRQAPEAVASRPRLHFVCGKVYHALNLTSASTYLSLSGQQPWQTRTPPLPASSSHNVTFARLGRDSSVWPKCCHPTFAEGRRSSYSARDKVEWGRGAGGDEDEGALTCTKVSVLSDGWLTSFRNAVKEKPCQAPTRRGEMRRKTLSFDDDKRYVIFITIFNFAQFGGTIVYL